CQREPLECVLLEVSRHDFEVLTVVTHFVSELDSEQSDLQLHLLRSVTNHAPHDSGADVHAEDEHEIRADQLVEQRPFR
ncbi:hypothetical protein PENTCL1PPCAC_21877, partial [Pristionchus entomophagus]